MQFFIHEMQVYLFYLSLLDKSKFIIQKNEKFEYEICNYM